MSEKTTGIVHFELDLDNPPQLTAEQKQQLEALRDMPEESIDFTDTPPLREMKWVRPGRGLSFTQNTVSLEKDVLDFFRADGVRPDPARINAALREYMATHPKAS